MKDVQQEKIKESENPKTQGLVSSIKAFSEKVDGFVYPLIIPPIESIGEDVLFEIYGDFKEIGQKDNLHVLLYSYGGNAHTAFQIGRLLQNYCKNKLSIYILKEAKSAATLISCAADEIIFSEISELGPMDPQIKLKSSDDRFSPLAIKHTFELLHREAKSEHPEIVKTLTEKLPDPLTLGELIKSLETGKDYLVKLLRKRMFKSSELVDKKPEEIAQKLVEGYPDHGYCIDFIEAQELGLKVKKVDESLEDIIFDVMKHFKLLWDEFDSLFFRADKKPEAFDLYKQLKNAIKEIIKAPAGKK